MLSNVSVLVILGVAFASGCLTKNKGRTPVKCNPQIPQTEQVGRYKELYDFDTDVELKYFEDIFPSSVFISLPICIIILLACYRLPTFLILNFSN